MKWVIAIPSVGAGNCAICLLLSFTVSSLLRAIRRLRVGRADGLTRGPMRALLASRVKLPNDQAEAHPEQRDIESQNQPRESGRRREQLLADTGDRRVDEIDYRYRDEHPDQDGRDVQTIVQCND